MRPYGVTMQLLLVRHALPLRSEPGQGSDPELSEQGIAQAARLPDALSRFPVGRLVSSPQRRAVQTAGPLADKLGLTVDIDERLAEYDRDMSHYVPIEQIAQENPEELARLAAGHLPSGVDEKAFLDRVVAAVDDLIGTRGDPAAGLTQRQAVRCRGQRHRTRMGSAAAKCAVVNSSGDLSGWTRPRRPGPPPARRRYSPLR